jgi:serine/threonine-protein kinase
MVEVCAQHLHSAVVPPSVRIAAKLPDKLEAVLLGCLEKERTRRPIDAETLPAQLDACDDCAAWTAADARSWWRARPPTRGAQRPLGVEAESRTLNVERRVAR